MELRMYGLVPYQLSGIQSGIQFGHAALKYSRNCQKKIFNIETQDLYNDWIDNWETVIILNGGTTNKNPDRYGTLNIHLDILRENGITVQDFYEPDLGDQLTGIAFIVDERVFNKEKYPDFINDESEDCFGKWFRSIGGKKNLFLRKFLKDFKLA